MTEQNTEVATGAEAENADGAIATINSLLKAEAGRLQHEAPKGAVITQLSVYIDGTYPFYSIEFHGVSVLGGPRTAEYARGSGRTVDAAFADAVASWNRYYAEHRELAEFRAWKAQQQKAEAP